jgi:demethylmenaquinone methyltransferase/2-methoxy-6-polyprenyl-1,4-benzoquinol methylase
MNQTPTPQALATPPKGTRPEGARSEDDASRQVREMFTQIAPRYDLLNHLLSMQLDRVWRARVARRLRPILDRPDALVLDLCCGTGDLAFCLARSARARIIGADFSHAMLVRARAKSKALSHRAHGMADGAMPNGSMPSGAMPGSGGAMQFFEADALCLPFADASFDLITTAFGFRNLANYDAGLREIYRLLKPGGTLAILEFTEPPAGLLGDLYRWYFRNVLPRIGRLLSGDRAAYSYLPASVSRFYRPGELASLMTTVGYRSVDYRVWTVGTVALHTAVKPA